MLVQRIFVAMVSACVLALGSAAASGQDYPDKPIRIITSAAGGGSDVTSRLIAQGIASALGQQIVVDNRTAILSADAVAKAPPDGYTLHVAGGVLWILPMLQKTPYDAVADFAPISLICREAIVLAVHPSVPAKSVSELIGLAKAKPGELNYASGASGAPPHLGAELFKSMAGVDIVRIAYKGSGPVITAMLGGEVHLTFTDSGLITPHVKTGKLRALAVATPEPSALAPGLPTVAASGLPGFQLVPMTGIWAPAKTPAAIINRLNQEITRFLSRPDTKEKLFTAGAEVVGSSPEQSVVIIKADIARIAKVIKEAGIRAD